MTSPARTAARLGRGVATGLGAYALSQVLTGVEAGIFAAGLVVYRDWALSDALTLSLTLGLPVMALQTAALGVAGWHLGERLSTP